jgi:hypothetical protein
MTCPADLTDFLQVFAEELSLVARRRPASQSSGRGLGPRRRSVAERTVPMGSATLIAAGCALVGLALGALFGTKRSGEWRAAP